MSRTYGARDRAMTGRDSLLEDPFVAETLAWCNEIRVAKGEEPLDSMPKGVRDDPTSCPCGRATGVFVDYTMYAASRAAWENGAVLPLPPSVAAFVAAFDAHELPQYDETPVEWTDEDDVGACGD